MPTPLAWTPRSRRGLFSLSQPGWAWGQSGHQAWQGEHWSLGQMQPSGIVLPSGPARYPAGAEFTKQLPLVPDPVSKPRIITVRVFALQDPWVHLAPS